MQVNSIRKRRKLLQEIMTISASPNGSNDEAVNNTNKQDEEVISAVN